MLSETQFLITFSCNLFKSGPPEQDVTEFPNFSRDDDDVAPLQPEAPLQPTLQNPDSVRYLQAATDVEIAESVDKLSFSDSTKAQESSAVSTTQDESSNVSSEGAQESSSVSQNVSALPTTTEDIPSNVSSQADLRYPQQNQPVDLSLAPLQPQAPLQPSMSSGKEMDPLIGGEGPGNLSFELTQQQHEGN